VSVETCEQLAGWDAVQEALGEIRACHGDFESFFSEVFDQLDGLASELTQRGKQWLAQRQEAQSELARRAEEIERQRATLAERQRELEEAAGGESEVVPPMPDPALEELLAEARREREQMQGVQDAVQAQVARLADVAAELASARQVARLADVAAELASARSRLVEPPENASHDGESLRQWLEEIHAQHQQLLGAQQAAQSQAEQLAGVVGELAAAREAWTAAQDQLREHREQLNDIRAAFASGQGDDELKQQISELQQKHAELKQHHARLEQERTLLEGELETVRNRAAEMAESLAEQKRGLARQQTQWADELKQMRRLMEALSRRLSETPPAPAAAPQPAAPSASGAEAGHSSDDDPVLDSVMAQFQMLQQDLARRRAKTA